MRSVGSPLLALQALLALTAILALAPCTSAARDLAVHPESRAVYAIDEDFLGGVRTVSGTNGSVTGTLAWSDSAGALALPARIEVDAADFHTSIHARDRKVRNAILEAATYPKIVFTLERATPALAKPLPDKATVLGSLEIHGRKKAVEIPVTIAPGKIPKTLLVRGETVVTLKDFDLAVPRVPLIAKARDKITLSIALVLDAP